MLPINDALSFQYRNRYATCAVPAAKAFEVDNAAKTIQANQLRYKAIGDALKIPFELVGVLAMRELSPPFNFHQHLANGDPLTAKTVHVPAGLPTDGSPPYSFEQGAIAALAHQAEVMGIEFAHVDWNIENTLCFLEAYNGLGYRKRFAAENTFGSPYLWSYTQYYRSGYYGSDGKWDQNLVCKSIGCAPVLKRLGFQC